MNFVANCVDQLVDYFAIVLQVIWYFVIKLCSRMCMESRSGNSMRSNQPDNVANKLYGLKPT
jgi:hypothetical protein